MECHGAYSHLLSYVLSEKKSIGKSEIGLFVVYVPY